MFFVQSVIKKKKKAQQKNDYEFVCFNPIDEQKKV